MATMVRIRSVSGVSNEIALLAALLVLLPRPATVTWDHRFRASVFSAAPWSLLSLSCLGLTSKEEQAALTMSLAHSSPALGLEMHSKVPFCTISLCAFRKWITSIPQSAFLLTSASFAYNQR